MFGMLDYRAYKLLWLICLPLRLIIWIAAWGSIAIAIMIGASLDYACSDRHRVRDLGRRGDRASDRSLDHFLVHKKGVLLLIDVVPAKAETSWKRKTW
jgi:hypothetical protein